MKYVLFVCNHSAGRSQMAEAFFNQMAPADVRAVSAGSEPAPAVWPVVVEAMREVGVDLAGRRPSLLSREMQLRADWAVTMGCEDGCPLVPGPVEEREITDPAGRAREEVREIRDEIRTRIERLLDEHLEDIRTDHTTHELWLAQLFPNLAEEFAGVRSDGEIRACADAVLETVADTRVRSHVLTLAYWRTRDCPRQERCDVLAVR